MVKYLFYFFLLIPCFGIAQSQLEKIWEKSYRNSDGHKEQIHDAIYLRTGLIAMVGETQHPDKGREGLFIIIDAETGEEITHQPFSGFGDDVLKSVVYGDYSFYAVGYTDEGSQGKRNGWLLELVLDRDIEGKENLRILRDTTFGTDKNDEFSKVIWTNRQTALIAGQSDAQSGNIWLINWDGRKVLFDKKIGNGICKSLIGLEKGRGDKIWLCGNSRKVKSRGWEDGDIWWVQIDETGDLKDHAVIGDKNVEEKIFHADRSLRGGLLMVGESNKRTGNSSDRWLWEIDHDKKAKPEVIYGNADEEKFTSVLKSPQGKYWMTTWTIEAGLGVPIPNTWLSVWNESMMKEPIYEKKLSLHGDNEFEAVNIVRTAQNQYILVGNELTDRRKHSEVKLICWQNGNLLAAKGLQKMENSPPQLSDTDRNGLLSAGERGAVTFQLKNTGDVDFHDGYLIVETINMVEGLTVKSKTQYFEYLPAGEQSLYRVDLGTADNLTDGISEMNIRIEINDKVVHRFSAAVKTGKPVIASRSKTSLDWRKPDVRSAKGFVSIVPDKDFEIQLNVNADRNLNREDFKVSQNGIILIDNKNQNGYLSEPIDVRGIKKYTFTYKIKDLAVGENIIFVSLGKGEESIPITVNYQPQQPNLHILAIGPTYADLKFSAKDASDFANAATKQAGRGFFNKVFVDTLTSPLNTSRTKISIAVKKLARRIKNPDAENYIKSNDYVMVFFSGHGIKHNERFKLLPSNYESGFENETTIDYKNEILDPLETIPNKVIVFIDACLSGNAKSSPSSADLTDALLKANNSAPGIVTISSCSAHELSYEDSEWKNGAFTKSLVEAMNNETVQLFNGESISPDMGVKDTNGEIIEAADNGILAIGELIVFLQKRVQDLVKHRNYKNQTPTVPVERLNLALPIFTLE